MTRLRFLRKLFSNMLNPLFPKYYQHGRLILEGISTIDLELCMIIYRLTGERI